MTKKRVFKLSAYVTGVCLSVILAALAALLSTDVIHALAADDLKEASYCSFVIPPDFEPEGGNGLFVNKDHPMESSSIQYGYYDNGLDSLPTNREKLEMNPEDIVRPADNTQNLTREVFQETMSVAYNSEYGKDVGYSVSSFDKITVDGYPGFKINGSFKASEEEQIHQTVYLLVSKYRTFTITYQRAEDDECEDLFAESAATIHVH